MSLPKTIEEAAALIASKSLSPVELVDECLVSIDEANPLLNAMVHLERETARGAAREAADEIVRNGPRSVLHGIPIGVKDLFDCSGTPTLAGARATSSELKDRDAGAVSQLRDAGAVIIGKAATHEFAAGFTTPGSFNPWDPTRSPGGSSGGSAIAVAAGMCLGAIGTDTAGSVRIPAAMCGVTGLKPTFGRISRTGLQMLSWSLDHVGPLARTATDAHVMLTALVGDGPATAMPGVGSLGPSAARSDLRGVRIGVPSSFFFDDLGNDIGDQVDDAIDDLRRLGAAVEFVDIPSLELFTPVLYAIVVAEGVAVHRDRFRADPDLYGDELRSFLEAGEFVSAADYIKALQARVELTRVWQSATADFDAIVAPTTPFTARPQGDQFVIGASGEPIPLTIASGRLTNPANVTGLPAISIPCGFDTDGLPIGIQLIGQAFEEAALSSIATAFQSTTDWHLQQPPHPEGK